MIHSRRSANESFRRNVRGHPTLRSDNRVISNLAVPDHSNLPCQNHPVPNFSGARQSDLRAKQSIFANVTAMSDLYQIVDLHPALYARLANAGAIDAGIGLHFHIVTDYYRSRLRDLVPSPLGSLGEAESVRADHDSVL